MFTDSPRLANIFMIVTALALCVSACTEVPVAFSSADISSFDTASAAASPSGFAHLGAGY